MTDPHLKSFRTYKFSRLTFAVLIAVAGCSKPEQANQTPVIDSTTSTMNALNWKPAPENSVAEGGTADMVNESVGAIRRCWQRSSGYDCLYVSVAGPMFTAKRYQMKGLNMGGVNDPAFSSFSGYSCRFFPSYANLEEIIAGSENNLTTNIVSFNGQLPNSAPWSAAHVSDYLAKNRITVANTHFDCAELATQVMSGSLDTVASTSISYNQIMH